MENAPRVEIEFLVDYELEFVANSGLDEHSDPSNLNTNTTFKGKKGFHLCGGSVDENGEVSGCLLDGTFTLYQRGAREYKGVLGNTLSNDNYEFETPEYIDFRTANAGTYIKSILVRFDSVAGEYATEMYFTNAVKADGTLDDRYTEALKIKNNKDIFIYHSFGDNSQITSIRLNISKWSKKNALLKITKISTGYTGNYDYKSLQSIKWDNFMFAAEDEITFGISSNTATIEINDSSDIIDELYRKNLIFQNVIARVYVDDILQGNFYIDSKMNERGSDIWTFECIDLFERIKDDIVPVMQLDPSGDTNLKDIIKHAIGRTGLSVDYSPEADEICENYKIPKAYIKSQQTVYEVLAKVCQVGMLRMYFSIDKLRIVKGV